MELPDKEFIDYCMTERKEEVLEINDAFLSFLKEFYEKEEDLIKKLLKKSDEFNSQAKLVEISMNILNRLIEYEKLPLEDLHEQMKIAIQKSRLHIADIFCAMVIISKLMDENG